MRLSGTVILPSGPTGERLQSLLNAIDSVHQIGSLPELPVLLLPSVPDRARYRYDGSRSIGIEIEETASSQELLLLHELGHFIDHQALGEPGVFATAGPSADAGAHNEVSDLTDALRRSPSIQELQRLSRTTASPRVRRYADYLRRPEEVFARAYMQYIVLRSDDRELKRQLRNVATVLDTWRISQWRNEEFRPILDEFDKIFERRNWRTG